METGLTLLSQASMPPSYWSYAFSAAVYLIAHPYSQPHFALRQALPANTKLPQAPIFWMCLLPMAASVCKQQTRDAINWVHVSWLLSHTEYISMSWSQPWPNIHISPCSIQWRKVSILSSPIRSRSTRNTTIFILSIFYPYQPDGSLSSTRTSFIGASPGQRFSPPANTRRPILFVFTDEWYCDI